MPVPYTRDALSALRTAARAGASRALARDQLGWDDTMFDRVCRQHGIDFPPADPRAPAAVPASPTSGLDAFIEALPRRQRQIMTALRPTLRSGAHISSSAMELAGPVVCECIFAIRRKMNRDHLPYAIDSNAGRFDGGYRIVPARLNA